jgi:uncharacterized membrane protein
MRLYIATKEGLKRFSDRAIAICFIDLIFTFSVPKFTSFNYDPNMDLAKLTPHLATFSVSFVTIAAFWIAQNRLFNFIRKLNRIIVWSYSAYFVCLVLVSVSAVSLSSDPFAKPVLMVYTSFLLLTAILHRFLLYAALQTIPSDKVHLTNKLKNTLKKIGLAGPACYITALAACFVNIYISFLAIIAAIFFYMFFLRKVSASVIAIAEVNTGSR